ncbi:hypothetical protein [Micromonospora sp. CPCC 206060]|uniref:hypothetical protein n=1 Tax=Micromonospora sp. CPCC 206060 TaxID=3122406 RepID=UPI003FA59073
MSAINDRIRSVSVGVARITLVPLLIRTGVFVTALAAFALAYPVRILFDRPGLLLLVAAVLPAVAPRRRWPTVAVLVAVAGWLLSTSWYGEPVALWRLLGLATLLYLTHTLAALAALLPYDAVVSPDVPTRWLLRALGVTLAGAVLSVLLISFTESGADRAGLIAALAGLGVAVLVAALLGWLFRRR